MLELVGRPHRPGVCSLMTWSYVLWPHKLFVNVVELALVNTMCRQNMNTCLTFTHQNLLTINYFSRISSGSMAYN